MKQLGPRQRWTILGSLLAATVIATIWVDDESTLSPTRNERPAKLATTPAQTEVQQFKTSDAVKQAATTIQSLAEASEDSSSPSDINPFRSKTWFIAPPSPPPPKPVAPPLPFRYLGQIVEDGEPRVFVEHQGRHLIIQAGEQIAGTYAVESISPGNVVFVYLPLKEQQTMFTQH